MHPMLKKFREEETRSIYRSKLRNMIPYLDSHFPDAIIEINKFNQSYSKYINCFLGQEMKDAKNQPWNLELLISTNILRTRFYMSTKRYHVV